MNFHEESLNWNFLHTIPEYIITGLIIFTFLAILFAPILLKKYRKSNTIDDTDITLVKSIRGFFALCLLFVTALHPSSPVNATAPGFVQFSSILLSGYLYYVLFFASGHFLRRQFGRVHRYQNLNIMVDTYRSRGFTILARLVLTAFLVIMVVHSLEADNLLRTSGLIAALLIVIGLSQSAWAPDYIGGLLILYSEMFKEGDTVKLTDSSNTFFGEIYRIKAFHTEILSLVDNHRVIVRNSRMREYTIHNLSKFASPKGLRERLSFKIGYHTPEKQVQAMFRAAFAKINRDHSIPIERHHEPEIRVQTTGDHAVEWSVYYFTKDTKKLLKTRQSITETILATSKKFNVSLATPLTHQVDLGGLGGAELFALKQALGTGGGPTYGQNFNVPVFSD